MIEAGKKIQKPFCQAVSEDIVENHDVKNFIGSFVFTVGFHSLAYIYAIYGHGEIDITDDWMGNYKVVVSERTFFKFPLKVYPEGIIKVETSENTLTQILIKDEY